LTGPVADTLVCLPSTVLYTLPLVLAGSGVEITACADVAGWLEPDTSERAAAFLEEVIGA